MTLLVGEGSQRGGFWEARLVAVPTKDLGFRVVEIVTTQ